jgi:MtN3 and saliva related transmembrane protein
VCIQDGVQDAIGWVSSGILVLTIGQQVYKQWHDETSKGVSQWLFVGQIFASGGFTVYSWLVHNRVFVVTNALMLCAALLGFLIVRKHRRAAARCKSADGDGEATSGRQGDTPAPCEPRALRASATSA